MIRNYCFRDKSVNKMISSLKILLFIPLLCLAVHGLSSLDCGRIGNCESVLLDLSLAGSLDGCVINGRQVPGAKFVSWNSIANVCEAYATCEAIDDSETNSLTSSVECDICDTSGLCLGHVVDDSIVEGEKECEQLCINEQTCEWYSYLEDQQFCLLFDICYSLDTSCSNCHTSMKTCAASVAKNKMFYVDANTGNVTIGKKNFLNAMLMSHNFLVY